MKKVLISLALVTILALGASAFVIQQKNNNNEKAVYQEQLKKLQDIAKENELSAEKAEKKADEEKKKNEELQKKLDNQPIVYASEEELMHGTYIYSTSTNSLMLRKQNNETVQVIKDVSNKLGLIGDPTSFELELATVNNDIPHVLFLGTGNYGIVSVFGIFDKKTLKLITIPDDLRSIEWGEGFWLSPDSKKFAVVEYFGDQTEQIIIFDLMSLKIVKKYIVPSGFTTINWFPKYLEGSEYVVIDYGSETGWKSNNTFRVALYSGSADTQNRKPRLLDKVVDLTVD